MDEGREPDNHQTSRQRLSNEIGQVLALLTLTESPQTPNVSIGHCCHLGLLHWGNLPSWKHDKDRNVLLAP